MTQTKTWERLLSQVKKKRLDFAEECAEVLANLNYQVQNGGFSQYIANGYIERDYEKLRPILGQLVGDIGIKVLRLVQQAKRIESYETSQSDYDVLDKLDDEFYKINDEFEEAVEKFLSNLEVEKWANKNVHIAAKNIHIS